MNNNNDPTYMNASHDAENKYLWKMKWICVDLSSNEMITNE